MGQCSAEVPIVEASHILDIFATELSHVEKIGSCVRFTLTTEHRSPDGEIERIVVAKIVLPLDAVPPAIRKTILELMLSQANFFFAGKDDILIG